MPVAVDGTLQMILTVIVAALVLLANRRQTHGRQPHDATDESFARASGRIREIVSADCR
jgi:hypothetical protein